MKFKKLFESLSIEQSLKIFDIDSVPSTLKELNSLYKKMALKYHPDRGGSNQQMQDLNDAKDVLSKNLGNSVYSKKSEIDRSEDFEFSLITLDMIREYFSKFNLDTFIKHLEGVFGEKLSGTVTEPKKFTGKNWDESYKALIHADYTSLKFEITNKSRDKVFEIQMNVDGFRLFCLVSNGKSFNAVDFDIYVNSKVFVNGKKQDLLRSKYFKSSDKNVQSDPNVFLPLSKLKKIASGSSNKRKISKRDFVAMFLQKFKGAESDNWYWIPFSNEYAVALYRNTILRQGCYQFYGIYENTKYGYTKSTLKFKESYWFVESQETYDKLENIFTEIQGKNFSDVEKIISKYFEIYKKENDLK